MHFLKNVHSLSQSKEKCHGGEARTMEMQEYNARCRSYRSRDPQRIKINNQRFNNLRLFLVRKPRPLRKRGLFKGSH